MEHVELSKIRMTGSAELSERWVQGVLDANSSLLGLGELDVRDAERRQPHGGRLAWIHRRGVKGPEGGYT